MKDTNLNTSEAPVPAAETANASTKNTKKKKIAIISVFLSLCILGAVSWVLLYLVDFSSTNKNPMFQSDKKGGIDGMYGNTQTYIFYPIDRDLDIMTDKDYLDLDRSLYYTKGAETYAIDKENVRDLTDDIKFFIKYFDLAIAGNYTSYNKLFTEKYYKSNEAYYSFTQQMIYDMHIEKLGEKAVDGKTEFYYDVSYKIHKNNGTFRNDIESDASKTLFFTLVETDSGILIDSIDYYVKG